MIEVTNLSKSFMPRGGRRSIVALQGMNLHVEENEFVTVVGQSGCGKSTLLRLISGLVPPSEGSVRIRGVTVLEPYRDVGFVFQAPVLLPWRTVLDNVMFSVDMLRLDQNEYRGRALELLATAGLNGFENHYPRELSGGMQQRVAICRGLVHGPSVLLMDEPFAALDAMTREEMSLELLRLWEAERKTVVFVTHSISEAILLSDKVVVMTPRPGRVAKILSIELPRPRTMDMQFGESFAEYNQAIRSMIFSKMHSVQA